MVDVVVVVFVAVVGGDVAVVAVEVCLGACGTHCVLYWTTKPSCKRFKYSVSDLPKLER